MAALIKSIVEKWVALYVRLSRDDENEGDSNSIAHQIEILTRYAKEHGITNYKIYKDDGYSGTNFKRPGFQEMLADIEAMKAEQDALGRSISKAKAQIQLEIGDAEGGQCDGWRVTWKTQNRTTVDGAALKRDYPEIYQKYSKTTTSRVFRQTKVREDKAS